MNIFEHIVPALFSGAILIAHKGEVITKHFSGMANYEHAAPNSPTTKFRIASLSKAFTSASILLLEQQGKLSTSDPVSRFIPDFPNGDSITLHHLMCHTSGLFNFVDLPDFNTMKAFPTTPEKSVALFKINKP